MPRESGEPEDNGRLTTAYGLPVHAQEAVPAYVAFRSTPGSRYMIGEAFAMLGGKTRHDDERPAGRRAQ